MKRTIVLPILLIALLATAVWAWNHSALQSPLNRALEGDPRNVGIEADAHFQTFINSKIAIFDLKRVDGNKSQADVFRALLQFAAAIQERQFETVVLAYRGAPKFHLPGDYFSQLGREYSEQNPIYTMRTFPENLRKPNGERAFGQWTGGMLGVLKEQTNDFSEFHKQWYLGEMLSTSP